MYADLPGVDPSDIEVSMEKGVLTIKRTAKSHSKEKKQVIHEWSIYKVVFIVAFPYRIRRKRKR
ncbi:Hsp20/alpha crystallin family protein [Rickettsiella massiliensis]|uniref:Hsp20/alpha crystallin family protein n=1 Tax=Rickettsiella massiliensis TaxID=676517 RepID=UPI002E245A45